LSRCRGSSPRPSTPRASPCHGGWPRRCDGSSRRRTSLHRPTVRAPGAAR
jgi:hypothetical protein